MNHLAMTRSNSFVESTLDTETTRYTEGEYGRIKEIRSSIKCCICDDFMWVRQNGNNWLIGYKVLDTRAYVGGLPDYLKIPNILLEVHFECQNELIKRLDKGEYINRPI